MNRLPFIAIFICFDDLDFAHVQIPIMMHFSMHYAFLSEIKPNELSKCRKKKAKKYFQTKMKEEFSVQQNGFICWVEMCLLGK